MFKILVINPGSTSTKIALYEDEKPLFTESIEHDGDELGKFNKITDQFDYRKGLVVDTLKSKGYSVEELSAVIGRGGLVSNLKTGGYLVDSKLAEALQSEETPAHASNLGGLIAKSIAEPVGLPALIYDAVTSGELSEIARITGIPNVIRQSYCHALNSRATAIKYSKSMGKKYEDMKFLVAHLGGGVSISAHKGGKIIDSLSDDDGQFSPERSGSVPLLNVIDLCYSGKYSKDEMKKMIRGKGGMYAHLGTSDCRVIEKRIDEGDEKAKIVFEAQAYQIAKGIGVLAPIMKGQVDAIILTGGVAHSKRLTDMITEYVEFIAPVKVWPGENEMEALALGALRILRKEEAAKTL